MRVTTIGTFPDRLQTETVIRELLASGIDDTEISSVYADQKGDLHDEQSDDKVESGAVTGATTGAVLGTLAGLVVANGILPGLGSVFIAGPLLGEVFGLTVATATTAAGALTGALTGTVVGALVKLGVSEEDAKIYEDSLSIGKVVVITRTDKSLAKAILEKNGATEIREYIED